MTESLLFVRISQISIHNSDDVVIVVEYIFILS